MGIPSQGQSLSTRHRSARLLAPLSPSRPPRCAQRRRKGSRSLARDAARHVGNGGQRGGTGNGGACHGKLWRGECQWWLPATWCYLVHPYGICRFNITCFEVNDGEWIVQGVSPTRSYKWFWTCCHVSGFFERIHWITVLAGSLCLVSPWAARQVGCHPSTANSCCG